MAASIPFFVFLVTVLIFLNPLCIQSRALEQEMESSGKHFVLVHGSNLGAWSWYKLIPLLESAGHNVTALDLAGNGVDPRGLDEITTFSEYVQPLTDFMSSLPDGERVVLVGHSYGGICISLAMENFSDKISAAVFVTAFMPNYTVPPVTVLEEYFNMTSSDFFLDSVAVYDSNNQIVSILFGPELSATKVYIDSPTEDAELAKTLLRPTGFYMSDLSKPDLLTENKYESVTRVFIISEDDQMLPVDYQKYMIERSPPKELKSINGSDHMVMISKPKELYHSLQEIADTYN